MLVASASPFTTGPKEASHAKSIYTFCQSLSGMREACSSGLLLFDLPCFDEANRRDARMPEMEEAQK